jgi:hypothetical protein
VARLRANGLVEHTNSLILDGLKKRLSGKNSKKGGKWIDEISSVIWALQTQPRKATGYSPFFLVYGPEAILSANIMWKSSRLRCMKKVRLITQDISNFTQLRKLDATSCSSRPTTYKESVVITTGMFNDALSILEIWFFDVSRMKPGRTSLIRDGKGPSSCIRLQDQGRIAYNTTMAWRFQTPRISSIYNVSILSQPRHLPLVPGDQKFQYNSILLVYNRYYTQVC